MLPGRAILGLCADPSLLSAVDAAFERPGGPAARWLSTRICPGCPIRDECLAEAIENGEHGPWGGTSRKVRSRDHGTKAVTYNLRGLRRHTSGDRS